MTGPAKDTATGGKGDLYKIIRDQLIDEIKAGRYPAGALLPSIREITVNWTVSTSTARKVLSELAAAGYARSQGTRGYASVGPTPSAPASSVSRDPAHAPAGGLTVRTPQAIPVGGAATSATTAVDVRVEPGPAEAVLALRVDTTSPVVVRRSLSVDSHGTPVQLSTSYTVREIADDTPLAVPETIDGPWIDALAEHTRTDVRLTTCDIFARHPTDSEAAMLALAPTACVLVRVEVAQDNEGQPIDYTATIWPGDTTRISALNRAEQR